MTTEYYLSAEDWNDPVYRASQRVSWAAPVCEDCWWQAHDWGPVRVRPPKAEVCVNCGAATRSGIFWRMKPEDQTFKAWEWIEP